MKLSISLSEDDVAVVDAFVEHSGLPSRSAAIQKAVQMLRYPTLEEDYAQAWEDWSNGDDGAAWEPASGDGLGDAPR